MRIISKIAHSLGAAGLIGGLLVYMLLLATAPEGDGQAYIALRQNIALISNYVILPTMILALATGLLSMLVHRPFLDRGWSLMKAVMGVLMFKGVFGIVGDKAVQGMRVADQIAAGTASTETINTALQGEWLGLWTIMAVSVANVVLGVWRPRFVKLAPNPTRQRKPQAGAEARSQVQGPGKDTNTQPFRTAAE